MTKEKTMASESLFEFKHDYKTIKVFTGETSADVYYSKNGGSTISAGLRFNEKSGNFTSGSGSSLSWDKAKCYIRNRL